MCHGSLPQWKAGFIYQRLKPLKNVNRSSPAEVRPGGGGGAGWVVHHDLQIGHQQNNGSLGGCEGRSTLSGVIMLHQPFSSQLPPSCLPVASQTAQWSCTVSIKQDTKAAHCTDENMQGPKLKGLYGIVDPTCIDISSDASNMLPTKYLT